MVDTTVLCFPPGVRRVEPIADAGRSLGWAAKARPRTKSGEGYACDPRAQDRGITHLDAPPIRALGQCPSRERRTAATTFGIGWPLAMRPQPSGSGAISSFSSLPSSTLEAGSASSASSARSACSSVNAGTRFCSSSLAVMHRILPPWTLRGGPSHKALRPIIPLVPSRLPVLAQPVQGPPEGVRSAPKGYKRSRSARCPKRGYALQGARAACTPGLVSTALPACRVPFGCAPAWGVHPASAPSERAVPRRAALQPACAPLWGGGGTRAACLRRPESSPAIAA